MERHIRLWHAARTAMRNHQHRLTSLQYGFWTLEKAHLISKKFPWRCHQRSVPKCLFFQGKLTEDSYCPQPPPIHIHLHRVTSGVHLLSLCVHFNLPTYKQTYTKNVKTIKVSRSVVKKPVTLSMTQFRLTTISTGHHFVWPLFQLVTISSDHYFNWSPFRLTTISTGHHFVWPLFQLVTIPSDHNFHWSPFRLTTISTGHHFVWPLFRLVTIPSDHYFNTVPPTAGIQDGHSQTNRTAIVLR